MKKRVLWLLCLIVSFVSAGAQTADTFTNPVIKGDLADPSVIRVGDTYYLTATCDQFTRSADLYTG
jgi:beta-xylosidase